MTREELNKEISKKLTDEQNAENNKILIKRLIKTIVLLVIFATLFFAYTTYVSTAKVVVREYRITNNKIPDSFNGIKLIQMSDIHYGSTISNRELKNIVELINKRKPDLVVFTGDLLMQDYKTSTKEQEELINDLKSISSTLGKYAILGDEDTDFSATILNQSDFTILRDEYDLIYNDKNNPILLVGLNSENKNQNIDKAYAYFKETTHNSNIYTVSILHEPDVVEDISNSYNSDLFISSGLGTKGGIRFFCRPSINFFRLSNK